MIVTGEYSIAHIYTNLVEQEAIDQVQLLLNQPMSRNSHARFMPDIHAGAGCVIGTTMHIQDKVIPNLVGVDIGCGMEVIKISSPLFDLPRLDEMLHKGVLVPSGTKHRTVLHEYTQFLRLKELYCYQYINEQLAMSSLGTLGGGNHFIEIDQNQLGEYYLVIHSGSRHLGLEVCKYYQERAKQEMYKLDTQAIIDQLKSEGREQEIESALARAKMKIPSVPSGLEYLEGNSVEEYLHDMAIVQEYADYNRKAMAKEIVDYMGWTAVHSFTTIHNYIDVENRILRKGAISAQKGEMLIIPLSMKAGSIFGIGKGNPEWNYSAPHGAGRLMSRSKARETLSVEDFAEQMQDVYTTCVGFDTLDESPMAYKPAESIIDNIKDTVEVLEVIKPVYNFKASI